MQVSNIVSWQCKRSLSAVGMINHANVFVDLGRGHGRMAKDLMMDE